jgi:peptidoglycan-N-acetylglucosamine deacetylase
VRASSAGRRRLKAGLSPEVSTLATYARLAQRRSLRRRCARSGKLVLSYDDGPGEQLTPKLLDVLAERGAHATFFPLGSRASGGSAVLDRAVAAGHELGCHGYEHVNANECPAGCAERDIEQGYAALARWVEPQGLFRPPYGKLSTESWRVLRRRGAPLGWWTVDSGDTALHMPGIARVMAAVARTGGGVVLMHDFDRAPPEPERERFVLELTTALLDLARERRWTVSTLGEVLA